MIDYKFIAFSHFSFLSFFIVQLKVLIEFTCSSRLSYVLCAFDPITIEQLGRICNCGCCA